jgi:hypothetical protein
MILKRISRLHVAVLVGVFLFGCIIGACYLSNMEACKLVSGFLPPYRNNIGGNYRDSGRAFQKLTKGMSKGEVVDLLSIGRVDVVAGNQIQAKVQSIMSDYQLKHEDITHIVEMWCIPHRTAGITDFVYLAFDKDQRLNSWGINEFMWGFPADRP